MTDTGNGVLSCSGNADNFPPLTSPLGFVIESATLVFEPSGYSWSSPLTFAIVPEEVNVY